MCMWQKLKINFWADRKVKLEYSKIAVNPYVGRGENKMGGQQLLHRNGLLHVTEIIKYYLRSKVVVGWIKSQKCRSIVSIFTLDHF